MLQEADVINIQVDQVSLENTIVQVHPGDTPEGRKLLKTLENCGWGDTQAIMDKAYFALIMDRLISVNRP